MLLTNILMGIIIFQLTVVFGGICNIEKILNRLNIISAEYRKLKKVNDDLIAREKKYGKTKNNRS